MKSSLLKNYYTRFVLNVITAAIFMLATTSFFVYNFIILEDNTSSIGLYTLLIFMSFGIIAFIVVFILLERKRNSYIKYLCDGIESLSGGNIDVKLELSGDDELSQTAHNINMIKDTIDKLVVSERESEKSKNELVTNIAHDLRTPLTSIIGYLDILVHNEKLTEEQKKNYTKIVYEKSQKLEVLIEDLFSFTKMNIGEVAVKKERIDIVKLIYQLASELYPLFENNDLEYEIQTNIKSLIMDVDPKLMVRLFENLINNAIKYGKDGKSIVIKIRYNKELHNVYISILNFGKKIPKESINKIFDKFYRADESRTSEIAGTGLGLAIAKSIVDLHDGEIKVTSDDGGTEFIVMLKENNE